MSIEGNMNLETVAAGADLSSSQYKVVAIGGTLAISNTLSKGVLQNKPQSGENASLGTHGKMKGVAGAAITLGVGLKVQSGGWLIAVTSGDGNVGKSNVAANSGDTFSFEGDFRNAVDTY